MPTDMAIKLRAAPLLIKKRLTKSAIARRITAEGRRVHPVVISTALAGTERPPFDVAQKISEILEVDVHWLFAERQIRSRDLA